MALEEYVGAVVVEVDGREIEAFSCSTVRQYGPQARQNHEPYATDRRVYQRRL